MSDLEIVGMQVKELVVQNADYVVDSLCRQLRHLELHPHAPTLLAAVLKHSGAAPHLLPLLEEPVRPTRTFQVRLDLFKVQPDIDLLKFLCSISIFSQLDVYLSTSLFID